MLTALSTALHAMRDQKLAPALGDSAATARGNLLPLYRSGMTSRYLAAGIAGLADLHSASRLGPGLPADRVTTLRRAFDQAMKDPDLLAETQKQKMDVDPENGENLEKLAQQILQQPAEVLARVTKILSN